MALTDERNALSPTAQPARPEGAPVPDVQAILDQETKPVPAFLRDNPWQDLGSDDIDIDRYLSREFHDREMAELWPKVWQMACREEDLLDIGDTLVYEVGRYSVLLVRTPADEIKAYPNACLHRGTQLRAKDGNVSELRCPFHGICWNLDGSLKDIPCAWDFPHVDQATFGLPEYQVASYAGNVFINMDPDAAPLEEYLGELRGHLDNVRPALTNRFKAVHVGRPLRANWKVAQEAFLEAYHVTMVHPQTLLFSGDGFSEYSIYPGEPHWNRLITPLGVPSPYVGPDVEDQDVVDALQSQAFLRDNIGEEDTTTVPEGMSARQVLAQSFRDLIGSFTGFDSSELTDAEVMDNIQYAIFPNVQQYTGLAAGLIMRFRPWGDDPGMSLMEVMFLYPLPEGARIHGVPMQMLGADEPWANAPTLGAFASALEQDMVAIPLVQRGLEAMTKPGVTLARYQESRIRHFHQTLDTYLGGS
jgi:nitrite reductase/ring-hydroxylating ferredoxin subunit